MHAQILIILFSSSCGLIPVAFYKAQHTLLLQAKCRVVPPHWPTALGEFRAFGSELGVVCVSGRHEQIDSDE